MGILIVIIISMAFLNVIRFHRPWKEVKPLCQIEFAFIGKPMPGTVLVSPLQNKHFKLPFSMTV